MRPTAAAATIRSARSFLPAFCLRISMSRARASAAHRGELLELELRGEELLLEEAASAALGLELRRVDHRELEAVGHAQEPDELVERVAGFGDAGPAEHRVERLAEHDAAPGLAHDVAAMKEDAASPRHADHLEGLEGLAALQAMQAAHALIDHRAGERPTRDARHIALVFPPRRLDRDAHRRVADRERAVGGAEVAREAHQPHVARRFCHSLFSPRCIAPRP
jgi:hypothetical protein